MLSSLRLINTKKTTVKMMFADIAMSKCLFIRVRSYSLISPEKDLRTRAQRAMLMKSAVFWLKKMHVLQTLIRSLMSSCCSKSETVTKR